MKRLLVPAMIAAAALAVGGLALATRGSDDSEDPLTVAAAETPDGTSTPGSTPAAASTSTTTVNLAQIDGLGAVLTDAEGRVLYVADEEAADSSVLCAAACEEFWVPAEAGSEPPTGAAGVTDLDVAERPDGTRQVTFEGRRLYTFTLDGPGEAGGEGLSDTFDDQRFTWHAVVVEAGGANSTAGTDDRRETATSVAGTATAGDVYDYPGY